MRRLPGALIFVAVAAVPAFAQTSAASDPPVIVTNGEAVLKRLPDRAFLTIATEVRDGKAANARRKSAEGMTEIRAAIVAAGVAESAIRTVGFSLQPEMERAYNGRPSVRNYVVRNQIEIRIDDVDKLADVIDAANTPKNIAITLSNPLYTLKDRDAADLEAVSLAVKNALARAKALAAGAGMTLGPVLTIEHEWVTPEPMAIHFVTKSGVADARMAGGAGLAEVPETPITPGEIEIRASVKVKVAIRPPSPLSLRRGAVPPAPASRPGARPASAAPAFPVLS